MRILMHCVYFPPEVGGLESHVFHLCRGLAARGHEVGIVTSLSRPGLPAREVMEGVRVWRTWLPSRSPAGWIAHSLGSVPRTILEARGADVLHAQAFASIPPLQVARGVTAAPLVATFHTSHFLVRARRPRWRPILRRLVRAPDHALAASREIAEVGEELAPGTRVEALTNGVDTDRFRRVEPSLPPGNGPRIVVPRRLFPKNGVETLVRAMPALLEWTPGVEALVVGDGPERSRLERLSSELGVDRQLRFLGARPNDQMPGLLSSASLAVIPSLMEATSVAALEAMACELPVVASDVGGLPEIVDNEVGGLVEPGNPGALAETIRTLLERPDLGEMGRAARARVVARWSNARLVDRHLEIYGELVERRRGRG
jgi:glycosyltransferase involved in cell wall biosynthesis